MKPKTISLKDWQKQMWQQASLGLKIKMIYWKTPLSSMWWWKQYVKWNNKR